MSWKHCMSQISYCWDTVSDTHNLEDKAVYLYYGFRGFSPLSPGSHVETSWQKSTVKWSYLNHGGRGQSSRTVPERKAWEIVHRPQVMPLCPTQKCALLILVKPSNWQFTLCHRHLACTSLKLSETGTCEHLKVSLIVSKWRYWSS